MGSPDVLDQYNFMFRQFPGFAEAAGCDPEAEECLSERNRRDIIAYMQLLAFEGAGSAAWSSRDPLRAVAAHR